MARIVCFGELLLRLGAPGRERLLQSPRFDVCYGGAEANVAIALARLGHASAMAVFYGFFVWLWLMGGLVPDPQRGFLFGMAHRLLTM